MGGYCFKHGNYGYGTSSSDLECPQCVTAERARRGIPAPSAVATSVIDKIRARDAAGLQTYGTTMDRTDLSRLDWLRHAQEEALDLAVYLEKLIQEADAHDPTIKCPSCKTEWRISLHEVDAEHADQS